MRIATLLTILFALLTGSGSYGQSVSKDSTVQSFVEKFRELGRKEAIKSMETVKANRASRQQRALLNDVRQTALAAKLYLQKGIDTPAISRALDRIHQNMLTAREGVLQNPAPVQTLRDLNVTSIVLQELLQRISHERRQLDGYTNQLMKYREHIDSVTSTPALLEFPADSANMMKYLTRLVITAKDVDPVDSMLKQSIVSVQDLQTRIDLLSYEVNANLEQVENMRKSLSAATFRQELPIVQTRSFADIALLSWKKDILAFSHYLGYYYWRLLLLVLLTMASWRFIWALKSRLLDRQAHDVLQNLVVQQPLLSAIIIVVSLGQFLFPNAPFLLNLVFWGVPAVALIFVFGRHVAPFWLRFWIVSVALFFLASLDNLLLQPSTTERWYMLSLAAVGWIWGMLHLLSARKSELREKRILYFIAFMISMETLSIAFNLAGRYNLAKISMTCGYFGIVIAILFLWTATLINQGLKIASGIYKQPDKHLFFINFDRVGGSAPLLLYIILIAGWFVLIARNFYVYNRVTEPLMAFITAPRTLGEYTFSIRGMLIFVAILLSAMFLSRLVSFFSAEDHSAAPAAGKKLSLGSWLLLIRIGIISGGLFLAVAAAGIPLDRITIVLGALSVGIGLGLQGLVSNLVSGLILAFEKPVNVGDQIEVNGTLGTMKSIGFRSSTIALVNGSVSVIPNSDILNHSLVNWTLGKRQVRGNFVVAWLMAVTSARYTPC
ncbi:mechanosensitive ion channel [Chitinophaga horti]|uniref:Mechanosensitive ion channel n=1 Tax=Chitinophaga horti TaxID=2920382 RepID=A0ABY6J7A0_9BACT|nr:mechanosensitive ion channel domain-containing protein [Chitinophaga horti]UYQ95568.1 mechanosensitive ion channel [Chitinophaga horti]